MDCPVDGTTLSITDRQGIEIDFCPKCRGVWLDRGELDKVIERSTQWESRDTRDRGGYDRDRDRDRGRDRDDDWDRRSRDPRKKKKSMLSELFEFGD